MSRARNFLNYWLPPLLWMLVIFGASSDSASAQHSSRILGPLLRWLFPAWPEPRVELALLGLRKCAHLTEYAVLALLLWRAFWKPRRADPRPWSWPVAGWVILVVALYAASDEIHQLFVPTREGSVRDVVVDTLGGAAGLLGAFALHQWLRQRRLRKDAKA